MDSEIKDIPQAKKELEKEMINGIIDYLKYGTDPNNNANSYLKVYNIVKEVLDSSYDARTNLLEYHNKIISDFVDFSFKNISKESNVHLIDSFIKNTEKINFLIYWMNKIFTYLDRLHTEDNQTLSKKAMEIYKNNFFIPKQNEIFKEVNKLIKDDRNRNTESRPKIKAVLNIIDSLDLIYPTIIKENKKIVWMAEKGTEDNSSREFRDKWYNETFSDETKKFAKDKAEADIHRMSAPEYILSQLKYLDEENDRKSDFINPNYHSDIDKINHKILIGEKAEEIANMDTGFSYMFTNKRNEELKKAYDLFSLYPESLK
jgi:hypothetical protein